MKLDYFDAFVTISTERIEKLVDFYRQLLQKQPHYYQPGVYAEFRLEKLRLGIFQPKPERQQEFANLGSSMSLCIEVKDLEQAIAYLTELGYPPPGEIIEASHGKEIYAYDPVKTRLILHQSKS